MGEEKYCTFWRRSSIVYIDYYGRTKLRFRANLTVNVRCTVPCTSNLWNSVEDYSVRKQKLIESSFYREKTEANKINREECDAFIDRKQLPWELKKRREWSEWVRANVNSATFFCSLLCKYSMLRWIIQGMKNLSWCFLWTQKPSHSISLLHKFTSTEKPFTLNIRNILN